MSSTETNIATRAAEIDHPIKSDHPGEKNQPIEGDHPIVLFDGTCGLCDHAVQFILSHDPAGLFHFAPLQSDAAKSLLRQYSLDGQKLDSIVLIENDRAYVRSEATLKIAKHLPAPWTALTMFKIIPARVRDGMYNFIARHRYQWFGKRDACRLPTASERSRFLA